MPTLAELSRRRNGRRLASDSVVADSRQTMLCTSISQTVILIGLLLNATRQLIGGLIRWPHSSSLGLAFTSDDCTRGRRYPARNRRATDVRDPGSRLGARHDGLDRTRWLPTQHATDDAFWSGSHRRPHSHP